jgi:dihydroxyacetone kinase-like predicted kinase
VTITDLQAQLAERAPRPRPSLTQTNSAPHTGAERFEVVAVVEGPGMARAYTELGARVVDGQAEPSLQELLDAIDAADAPDVVVLPNESNVVAAAEQAARLAHKRVHVLPSRHALAGLASLVALDPAASAARNLAAMQATLHRTRAGRVAPVVRESVVTVGPVHPGQWIAIADRQAVAVADTPVEAALALADHLRTPATEVLTVAWGTGATEEWAAALRNRLSADDPEDVIDVFDGGHHDAFWISAEDMLDADPGETGEGVTDCP